MGLPYRIVLETHFGVDHCQVMSHKRLAESPKAPSGGSGSLPTTPGQSEGSGSKASSPAESIDFRFLNFAHPRDAKDAVVRRSVRSHVTARQHQNTRRVAAELAQRSQQSSAQSSSLSTAGEQDSSNTSPGTSETEPSSPEGLSPPASPPVQRSSRGRINPLEVYPEEWHPSLRPVMDHYVNTMSIDLPDTTSYAREQLRSRFLALVFTDPASLHALMLTTAAHYTKVRGPQAHSINILQLKGMAIQEINRVMTARDRRSTSDQLIAAVGKMATYELMFGQRDTFHTHMTGLQRMVSLRGGLQALGLSGMLERILLWIDANATVILGCPLYFPPAAFASATRHPQPDRRLFLLGLHAAQS